MNPHIFDVNTTNFGGVDWADRLCLYLFLCGTSICFGFVLIWLPVTHIFWNLKAVWNVHKIFSALSWERESSAISTPGNLPSDISLHVSWDPLTNISTKINGHQRQCITVNSKAKKEIREILWNDTQKYQCTHLRTLVSGELYLTRSVIESFCAHILETMTERSWITAREATWWKGSNNLLLS